MKLTRRDILFYILMTLFFCVVTALMFFFLRPAAAQEQGQCRENPIVFYCYPGLGCAVDPVFSKTVTEMTSALGLPDSSYRPCRLIIDTTKGRYEVPYPLLTICWNYVPLCGTTARTFAQAVRGEGVAITNVHVWLERHIPHYVPLAVEQSGWREEDWHRGDVILPVAPGYPPPPMNTPVVPYP